MNIKIPHIHIIFYNYIKRIEEVILTSLIVALRPFTKGFRKRKKYRRKQEGVKIAHYTESPWFGGPIKSIILLIKYLNSKNYRQAFICRNDGENNRGFESKIDFFKNMGVKMIKADFSTGYEFSLPRIIKLTLIFRKLDLDILHIHKANWYHDKTALLAGQLAGIPSILTYELCGDSPNVNKKYQNWIKGFRDRYIVDKIMIISREMEAVLCDTFGQKREKIIYMPNFRNVIEFRHEDNDDIKFRKKYDLSKGDRLIGVSARLVPEKGLEYLLEAVSYVLPSFPQIKVLFAGEGHYKKELVNKCENLNLINSVKFLGHIEEMNLFYKLLCIGLLPSLSEGMPGAVLEYMAAGLPVVATSVNGTKDLVIDEVTGYLVPVRNPKFLAEAIIKLLENPEMAAKMGENGRKRVEQEFSTNIVGEKMHHVYKELISTC